MRTTGRENVVVISRARWLLPVMWLFLSLGLLLISAGAVTGAFAAAPISVGGKAVVVNTGGDAIRVREGAGSEYARVGSVYEGQIVTILAGPKSDSNGKSWLKAQTSAASGWISAEFLEGTSASSAAPVSKLTNSARVANTDGDPLRVRAAPTAGPAGKILIMLDPGTVVGIVAGPVTDETGVVWYQITAKSINGWAMAQYLVQSDMAQPTKAAPTPTARSAVNAPRVQPTTVAAQSPVGATTTLAQYRQWMEEARVSYPYPQSVDKMWRVMMCESGGNPGAIGGGYYRGLFQYAPPTWAGSWNPYRSESIWDPKSQIFATAKAWSIGMQSAWSCYYITAGR